jgi:hypothetical protein
LFIFVQLKKSLSILFAAILLISSGLVQFVVHVCPQDGTMLSSYGCNDHEQIRKSACCDEGLSEESQDDCCSDKFVFLVSAKFGSFIYFTNPQPGITEIRTAGNTGISAQPVKISFQAVLIQPDPPENAGREILRACNRLII